MGARHGGRRAALQALYALDANPGLAPRAAAERALEEGRGAVDRDLALDLVEGAWTHRDELDRRISEASRRWRLDRMDRVDRSVLRLAVYELVRGADPPVPVVLDEAVELAKEFGTDESAGFVNGILDRIARECRRDEPGSPRN